MKLKNKLQGIKSVLFSSGLINRDYEFDAEFVDHDLGDADVYRLHYINYHRIGENYGYYPNNSGVIDYAYKPFLLPKNMERLDAFKVLSYLTDYLEKNLELKECSQASVVELDRALNLERLGFTRLNINVGDNSNIIELFTVTGRLALFKESKYYDKYYNWYTEGVTFEEVKDIYSKCGIDFYDINIIDNEDKKVLDRK